jgi:phage terminase large subunit-like protein
MSMVKRIDFAAALAELESWSCLARPNQLPPPGEDWFIWLLLAGRGFGKTRSLVEFVCEKVNSGAAKRVALVAPTAADARNVWSKARAASSPVRRRGVGRVTSQASGG